MRQKAGCVNRIDKTILVGKSRFFRFGLEWFVLLTSKISADTFTVPLGAALLLIVLVLISFPVGAVSG